MKGLIWEMDKKNRIAADPVLMWVQYMTLWKKATAVYTMRWCHEPLSKSILFLNAKSKNYLASIYLDEPGKCVNWVHGEEP